MKKVIITIVLVLLLTVGGGILYFMNTDWIGQNQNKISEQFYNSTGKIMRFNGPVNFRFFPIPHLHANNVKIYNDNTDDTALADIRSLDAELALKPLIKNEFEVTKMELKGAIFNIDLDKGFSWQSDLSPDQRQMMEETKLSLNNAQIKDSEIIFKSTSKHISLNLKNFNGEITAESLLGPFRIEGNYINGSTPEGFAVTIGRLSGTSATPLNIAITHPSSNSYLRFDGSFQSINKVLNGNIIIETENLNKFVNSNFNTVKLPDNYKQKAALGFDIAYNPQKIALNNVVVEYGDNTSGSGNIQIPLDDEQTPVQTTFNFTDIDANIFTSSFDNIIDILNDTSALPKISVDGQVNALRVHFNNQQLHDMELAFEYYNQILNVKKGEILLPGNTRLNLSGEVFPLNNILHYKSNVTINTDNLLQTMKWLDLEPIQVAPSVYKNMAFDAKISGNFERMQISPFKLTLDKSTISGEAGLIFSGKKDIMLIAQADSINFDNYIPALPEEIKQKNWLERLKYRLQQYDILQKNDMVLDIKSDLIIFENMPFEKITLKGNLLNHVAEIENLNIKKIANTELKLHGKLSQPSGYLQFDQLNYDIQTPDLSSLINKLEIPLPPLDYKRFNNLSATGTINGTLKQLNVTTSTAIGNLQADYNGKLNIDKNNYGFDGALNLKHPNFSTLLANIKSPYIPQADNLGSFQLAASLKGSTDEYNADNINLNIGQTNISGKLFAQNNQGKYNYTLSLKTNKLDLNKLLPRSSNSATAVEKIPTTNSAFISHPYESDNPIEYSIYNLADILATIENDELIWRETIVKNNKFKLEIINNSIALKDFNGNYNDVPFNTNLIITTIAPYSTSWSGSITNAMIDNFGIGGKTYFLRNGTFSTSWDFKSTAEDLDGFWNNLSGSADFSAENTEVNGLNFASIHKDLLNRDNNSGLSEKLLTTLKNGSTLFSKISGKLNFNKGEFNIADAFMNADNLKIKIFGDGTISDWKMNTIFNAKFDNPQYLPEFSFMFKSDISNPALELNVDALSKFYQSKSDQQYAEEQKNLQTIIDNRTDAFAEQRKIADNLITEARDTIEKDLDEKIQTAYSDKSQARYIALKQELGNILASLIEGLTTIDPAKLQDNNILDANQINKTSQKAIKELSDKVLSVYLDDLKIRLNDQNNRLTEEYNLLKQLSFYQKSLPEKYKDRLNDIITNYNLEEDTNFQQKQDEFLTKIAFLEKLNQDTVKLQQNSPKTNIDDYKNLNDKLEKNINKLKTDRETLKAAIENFDIEQMQKINNIISEYQNITAQKADDKLIKENTGSIHIKSSGKTIKISRDLDEIKNTNEQIDRDQVKVLDFTKPKINPSPLNTYPQGIVKKGGNIIAK